MRTFAKTSQLPMVSSCRMCFSPKSTEPISDKLLTLFGAQHGNEELPVISSHVHSLAEVGGSCLAK